MRSAKHKGLAYLEAVILAIRKTAVTTTTTAKTNTGILHFVQDDDERFVVGGREQATARAKAT
jgi:hypothetical protein